MQEQTFVCYGVCESVCETRGSPSIPSAGSATRLSATVSRAGTALGSFGLARELAGRVYDAHVRTAHAYMRTCAQPLSVGVRVRGRHWA